MFLKSIHQSRALAIIIVTAGHVYGALGPKQDTHLDILIASLIDGGTTLFVFISGFLFHRVFFERYRFNRFISNKIKNVLVPYLILSAFPIFHYLQNHESLPVHMFGGNLDVLLSVLRLYATGEHMVAYWFIPFIMTMFLLSPLHHRFASWSLERQLIFIVLSLIVSMLVHRPINNINILQSIVYFTPVYCLGISTSKHFDKAIAFLKGKETILLISIVSIALIQAFVDGKSNYHKEFFLFDGIDLMILQKLLLAYLMLVFFHHVDAPQTITDKIANMSFAIYFLHPYFIFLYPFMVDFSHSLLGNLLAFDIPKLAALLVVTTVIVAGSLMSGILAKHALGRYSRYLIGY